MSAIQTPILEVGGSSQPILKFSYKVTYEKLQELWPITRLFAKAIGLLPVSHNLLHHSKKKETTHISVLVTSLEDLVFSTLEELVKSSENIVQKEPLPPINKRYEEGIVFFFTKNTWELILSSIMV